MSLGKMFWELLRKRGDQVALIKAQVRTDGRLEAVEWSSDRVQATAVRLALSLKRQGLGPGQRVLMACTTNAEALVVALSVWMLGGVTVHLEPGLEAGLLTQALERSKASWVVIDKLRTLGALEVASGASVAEAQILLLDPTQEAGKAARVSSYKDAVEEGKRLQVTGLSALARGMFEIPDDARAMILYWAQDEGGLGAAALAHSEMLTAMAPLPLSWGLKAGEVVFMEADLGSRAAVLTTLRLLHEGMAMAFAAPDRLLESAQLTRPVALLLDPEDLDGLLEALDRALNETAVRARLRQGLDWVGRQRRQQDALTKVVGRMDGWLERKLADELVKGLGGNLRMVWSPQRPLGQDAAALIASAGIAAVEGTP